LDTLGEPVIVVVSAAVLQGCVLVLWLKRRHPSAHVVKVCRAHTLVIVTQHSANNLDRISR
jgi:hypothetical protein